AFLSQQLQLGDRFQVLGPACGSLDPDQPIDIQEESTVAEYHCLDGVRLKRTVVAAAQHLAEQVDIANGGGETEVEPTPERALGPLERQPIRHSSQIWIERFECTHHTADVFVAACIDQVDVLCHAR